MDIVVTGRAYDNAGNFVPRDVLERQCRAVGIYIHDSMSFRMDALVASDDAIRKRTTKVKAAEQFGMRIWSYMELFTEIRSIHRQRQIAAGTPVVPTRPAPPVPVPALDPDVVRRAGGQPSNQTTRRAQQSEDWAALDLLPIRLYRDYADMLDGWTVIAGSEGLLIEWHVGPDRAVTGHGNDVIRFRVLRYDEAGNVTIIAPGAEARRINEFFEGYAQAMAERDRAPATHRPVSRRLKL